jgi:hypothetical protein
MILQIVVNYQVMVNVYHVIIHNILNIKVLAIKDYKDV